MTSLVSQLKEGSSGKVAHFTDDLVAGKLVSMGVLPGSKVEVICKAPFNGGFYLKIDGSNMVLRSHEAGSIMLNI